MGLEVPAPGSGGGRAGAASGHSGEGEALSTGSGTDPRRDPRQRTRRDLVLLTLLCLVTYFPGLTTHGLTNWQEAQRAVVAREMQANGSWLVPTINAHPYLAKPPLIYWCQLALAEVTGGRVGLFHLRLTVALAGLVGVLATYVVARRLLKGSGDLGSPTHRTVENSEWSRGAAWWAALSLATGFLYVRSSRIGELDILLVPFVVVGVGAVAAAWRSHRERGRTNFAAVVLGAVCAVGAALTKGPPGLLVLGLAGYGGIALQELRYGAPFGREPASTGRASSTGRNVARGLALVAFGGGLVAALRHADPGASLIVTVVGAALIGLTIGALTFLLIRVVNPVGARSLLRAYARTHPVGVLGAGALALWLWGHLVRLRVGDAAARFVSEEAEDNLRLLVPQAPINNLEAAAFGVGLGSVGAILAVIWLLRERPRLRPGWGFIFAWVGLGLAAFSLLGKGVGRYLTPLWPGIAILGGMFLAGVLIDSSARGGRRLRTTLGAIVVVLAGAQSWYYGYGRERYDADRSARALVGELLAPPLNVDPSGVFTFEFRTPAVDYELDRWVQPVGETGLRAGVSGGESWTLDELRERVRSRGPVTLLVRLNEPSKRDLAVDRLRGAGFTVDPIATHARFTIDAGKAPVGAVRVGVK
jgi:hypothetical protein